MVLLTNFPPPAEGIRHQQVNTTVDIDGKDFGNGTLHITESCVAWQKESDGLGFSLQYPGISCHAISRDLTSFPHECLYLMLDGKLPVEEPVPNGQQQDGSDDDDDDDDGQTKISEVRFVPADKTVLQTMYTAMSACQALHPDPEDADSEEEEFADYNEDDEEEEENGAENGYFDSEEGAAHLTPAGRARLAHFDNVIQFQGDGPGAANGHQHIMAPSGDAGDAMDMDQFQDADDMQ